MRGSPLREGSGAGKAERGKELLASKGERGRAGKQQGRKGRLVSLVGVKRELDKWSLSEIVHES